jgi:hypothetical protein
MKRSHALVCVSLLAAMVGCDVVTVDAPIGDPLSQAEMREFVGRWINQDSEVFDIMPGRDGRLAVGTLRWDEDAQTHQVENNVVDARKVGDAIYFFVSGDKANFLFTRIERTGKSEFVRCDPDANSFRKAIASGQLEGKVIPADDDDHTIQVKAASPLTEKAFSAERAPMLFGNKDDQQIFRRIKEFDEPK